MINEQSENSGKFQKAKNWSKKNWLKGTLVGVGIAGILALNYCGDKNIKGHYNEIFGGPEKVEVVDTPQSDSQNETTQADSPDKPDPTYKSDKDQKTDPLKIDSKRVNQLEERVSGLEKGFDSLKEDVKDNSISYRNLSDKVDNMREDINDLDKQVASIYSGLQKENDSIKNSLDELREKHVSLEKRLDKRPDNPGGTDTVYMDSKKESQREGDVERDHSRPGMSKEEDPGRKGLADPKESFWTFLDIKYDCSGESHKVTEGLEDWNRYTDKVTLDNAYVTQKHPSEFGKEDLNSNYERFSRKGAFGERKDLGKQEFNVDSTYTNESWNGVNYRFLKVSPVEGSE